MYREGGCWTYKRIILAKTILIFPVMCSSREAGWKKSQPPFWNGSPTGLQSVLTLNTKEKEACHVWHDELKVWSWPGAPARRLAQKRPGNKQSLKRLTDTQRAQTSPTHQTGVSQSWHEWHPGLPQKQRCKLMKAVRSFFFPLWSEKTSTSSPWHYFLSRFLLW